VKTFAIVKVLVVNERGELLALQRDPNDLNRPGQWDFPGGNVEDGEELAAAARRETQEETGLDVAGLELVYGVSAENPKGSGTWLFFLARVQGRPEVRLSHEHVAFRWVSPAEFLRQSIYPRHQDMLRYLLARNIMEDLA
jgi:8-oxo-dGTP diphosphatase